MSKYVVYADQLEYDKIITIRILVEDAIRQQKEVAYHHSKFVYETDEQALQDFLICNWGRIEEDNT